VKRWSWAMPSTVGQPGGDVDDRPAASGVTGRPVHAASTNVSRGFGSDRDGGRGHGAGHE
jgi:hypothetical protein